MGVDPSATMIKLRRTVCKLQHMHYLEQIRDAFGHLCCQLTSAKNEFLIQSHDNRTLGARPSIARPTSPTK